MIELESVTWYFICIHNQMQQHFNAYITRTDFRLRQIADYSFSISISFQFFLGFSIQYTIQFIILLLIACLNHVSPQCIELHWLRRFEQQRHAWNGTLWFDWSFSFQFYIVKLWKKVSSNVNVVMNRIEKKNTKNKNSRRGHRDHKFIQR